MKTEMTEMIEIIEEVGRRPKNCALPGNPRYQPKSLVPYFGYDNLVKFQLNVEWALLKVLAKLGVIPQKEVDFLTDNLFQNLCDRITTTMQDGVERKITKHDIRALVEIMKALIKSPLSRWTHFSATSYDIIDTARIVAYKRAFWQISFPCVLKLISNLRLKILEFAETVQIGRTHGQHAQPITVGFWLATILARIIDVAEHLKTRETELVGKFSGAVGTYNSQVAFGLEEKSQKMFGKSFEELVLAELNLAPSPISTQILPPESLARFLFEFTLLSAALAQLSLDCRQLQRTEIAEVVESFENTQVGSSAMPHKRNPVTFEGTQGLFLIVKNEFGKVLDSLYSEHQRDLITSSVMREFPGIVVLVQYQLENLNRVVPKLSIDRSALRRNFGMNKHLILSEAVYLALIMAGYQGDAHHLVNHTLVPRAQISSLYLITELTNLAKEDQSLARVVKKIPEDLIVLLKTPENFIGMAKEKALSVAEKAEKFLKEQTERR